MMRKCQFIEPSLDYLAIHNHNQSQSQSKQKITLNKEMRTSARSEF